MTPPPTVRHCRRTTRRSPLALPGQRRGARPPSAARRPRPPSVARSARRVGARLRALARRRTARVGARPRSDAHLGAVVLPAPRPQRPGRTGDGRLVAAQRHRGGRALRPLLQGVYALGLQACVRHNLMACKPGKKGLFERVGFVLRGTRTHIAGHGACELLRLDLHDEQHLERVRSPLLPLLHHHYAARILL